MFPSAKRLFWCCFGKNHIERFSLPFLWLWWFIIKYVNYPLNYSITIMWLVWSSWEKILPCSFYASLSWRCSNSIQGQMIVVQDFLDEVVLRKPFCIYSSLWNRLENILETILICLNAKIIAINVKHRKIKDINKWAPVWSYNTTNYCVVKTERNTQTHLISSKVHLTVLSFPHLRSNLQKHNNCICPMGWKRGTLCSAP